MQQIYRKKPKSKCDFNKVAKQLLWGDNLHDVNFRKRSI